MAGLDIRPESNCTRGTRAGRPVGPRRSAGAGIMCSVSGHGSAMQSQMPRNAANAATQGGVGGKGSNPRLASRRSRACFESLLDQAEVGEVGDAVDVQVGGLAAGRVGRSRIGQAGRQEKEVVQVHVPPESPERWRPGWRRNWASRPIPARY